LILAPTEGAAACRTLGILFGLVGALAFAPLLASDSVEAAVQWIDTQPAHMIVTDGYLEATTPSLNTPDGQQRMLPVALLTYYSRAWQTFLDQPKLSERQREPRHYKIGHEIEGDVLTIVVQGLLLPRIDGDDDDAYLRVSLGPSLRLRYSLVSGTLLDRQLLR
jgi:hypothetical protein